MWWGVTVKVASPVPPDQRYQTTRRAPGVGRASKGSITAARVVPSMLPAEPLRASAVTGSSFAGGTSTVYPMLHGLDGVLVTSMS